MAEGNYIVNCSAPVDGEPGNVDRPYMSDTIFAAGGRKQCTCRRRESYSPPPSSVRCHDHPGTRKTLAGESSARRWWTAPIVSNIWMLCLHTCETKRLQASIS